MPSLAHYMEQYDHEHGSAWNKLLHGVGIPMIFAGIILLFFMKWIWAAGFFLGGWVLLFLGHRIEGNHPAFFQGPVYLLVGPIWVAKEVWTFLTGTPRKPASEDTPQGSAPK
jgi:hypothetical protein